MWVLVLYRRPFYFFVVIVESLLRIFVYCSFCFRCSAVFFRGFCTGGNAVACWLQIPLWYVVFNNVCEIALSEVLATQMGMIMRSIKVSSFEMHKFDPFLPHRGSIPRELVHSYVACEPLLFLQHSRPAWVELFVDNMHTHHSHSPDWHHFRESHVTDGEPESVVLASLQKIKLIKNLLKHFLFH